MFRVWGRAAQEPGRHSAKHCKAVTARDFVCAFTGTTTTNTNITSTTTVDSDLKSFLKSNNYIIKYKKLTFTSGSNFSPSDHSGYNFYCIHKYYFT